MRRLSILKRFRNPDRVAVFCLWLISLAVPSIKVLGANLSTSDTKFITKNVFRRWRKDGSTRDPTQNVFQTRQTLENVPRQSKSLKCSSKTLANQEPVDEQERMKLDVVREKCHRHSLSIRHKSEFSRKMLAKATSEHSNPTAVHVARAGASTAASLGVKTITLTQKSVFNFFSGGVAGTIASCVTNPLEVIKTQLQSSTVSKVAHGELASSKGHPISVAKTIMERDGVIGFWKGMKPTLVGIIPARSAYFYAYQVSKKQLGKLAPDKESPWGEGQTANSLLAGLLAGIVGNSLTNPIWMVKTRMQLLADGSAGQRAYKSYGEVISTIFQEEGIGGFYKGIFASYWGCAEGAVQFAVYEKIKKSLLIQQNKKRESMGLAPTERLPQATYFWAAAASKGLASIATYPHEVARTRLREQARDGIFKYHGMWQTIGLVAKEEGWPALYSGLGIHLCKVVPNSAIMFLTYEVVNHWLDRYEVVEG